MSGVDSQNRRLYIGSHDGVCALSSSDGGKTWDLSQGTSLAHAASRLTASAANPKRAYLAAYEAGVYRTDDGGATWQHLSAYPSDYAHSVLVHPDDPQRVWVGSEPATIFSSRDGGDTWVEDPGLRAVPESSQWSFHAATRDSHVRDLRMAPHDSNILYAGVEVGGMVRSRDGGQTWRQLPGLNDDVHCIGLSLARPQTVYVATARGPYRSDDEGENWEFMNQGIDRRYALHIAVAPEDADIVLLTVSENSRRGNPQLLRSTNGGRNWQAVGSVGGDDDMVVGIDWDPNNPRRVYAGTDHGRVYSSEDNGESWTQIPVELGTIAVGALIAGGG